ncbi:MAG: VOC family protein [Pseudomonadota bacterium]
MTIIDHLSVGVDDLAKAKAFYNPVLNAIDINLLAETEHFLAYGKGAVQFLAMPPYDKKPASAGNGVHICFTADSDQAVRDFHNNALKAGGVCEGEPGPRPAYPTDNAYAAYVRDPFGNKLEVIHGGFAS